MYFWLGDLIRVTGCSSLDRYRKGLKGTWKDNPLAASGATYDLGAHQIDQALFLFGRPAYITAFIQNLRCIGNSDVDDSVSGQYLCKFIIFLGLFSLSSQSTCITRQESGHRTR